MYMNMYLKFVLAIDTSLWMDKVVQEGVQTREDWLFDLPCLYIVVDGSVQLFLRGQVVSPMLLQFHNFCREGIASQVHSWAMIKFM